MNMKLIVYRKYKKQSYTIGELYIDGKFFSNTLEDTDRGLSDSMSVEDILRIKKPSITAIPIGTYNITIDVISPKFSSKSFYREVCNGRLPRLLNVKGFDGILIHVGDGPSGHRLTEGCLLVGRNTIKGGLSEGKKYFQLLYNQMLKAKNNGEKITITIMDSYRDSFSMI